MKWQISTQSHCGNVRKINEDALLVSKDFPLFAVADGMGGHLAGEIASQILIDDLTKLQPDTTLKQSFERVKQSILNSNQQIIDYSQLELSGLTMGSTIVVMLCDNTQASCLWAGDSRLYRLRNHSLSQLTEDHSQVAMMVKEGLLSPEEARHHPASNMITRAVGVASDLDLESISFDIRIGDTYLLCSDGLYGEINDKEISLALTNNDVYRCSVQLLNLCLSRAAKDNISFIIAHALDEKKHYNRDFDQTGIEETLMIPRNTTSTK